MSHRKRVVVGMSGGIDSTVAVCRLQAAGFEVVGLTLRLRACTSADGARRSCCGPDAAGTAGALAHQLGIRHYVLDCVEAFERDVLRPCWADFAAGRTPNPCILCNARVRFPRLLAFADDAGADTVATGHYARLERGSDGAVRLLRGMDPRKDQSYFLHAVPEDALIRLRFPLGGLCKAEVRAEARTRGLANAERAESQDVCVTGVDGSFAEALRLRFGAAPVPGAIRDREGRVLGPHAGMHRFTIGQRRGLGIAVGRPVRVCSINPDSGEVVVSPDPRDLLSSWCAAEACRWIGAPPRAGERLQAQIRYQQASFPVVIETLDHDLRQVRVGFESPVSAVTPGQWLVLYDGATVVGGGVIAARG